MPKGIGNKRLWFQSIVLFLHNYHAKVLAIFYRFQNIDRRSLDRVIGILARNRDGLSLVAAICRLDKSQLSAVTINKQ